MQISLRIFKKVGNGANGFIRGLADDDSWKNLKSKFCDPFPLNESNTSYVHETFTHLLNKPTKYEYKTVPTNVQDACLYIKYILDIIKKI